MAASKVSKKKNWHCVKSVQTRSFVWSVFSPIRTEYRENPSSVRMRENAEQKKLRIWTFFMQCGGKKINDRIHELNTLSASVALI